MTLPYSPQAPQANFIRVDYNSLPLPRLTYIPQQFQQYFPFIVGTTIELLQNKATMNPLRMFMFNSMAGNGYVNAEFSAAVEYIVRLLELRINQNAYRSINDAVMHVAETCLEHLAVFNLTKYNELSSFIDQSTLPALQKVMQSFANTNQELNNQQMAIQQNNQYQQPVQQPIYSSGQYNLAQQNQPMQQAPNFLNQAPANNWRQNTVNNSGVFVMPGQQPQPVGGVDRFSRFNKPVNNTPVAKLPDPVIPVQATQVAPVSSAKWNNSQLYSTATNASNTNTVTAADISLASNIFNTVAKEPVKETVKEPDVNIIWKPSLKYPYTYAYDPNINGYKYVLEDGVVIQKTNQSERGNMNQADHFVVPSLSKEKIPNVPSSQIKQTQLQTELSIDNSAPCPILRESDSDKSVRPDSSLIEIKHICDIGLATMNKVNGQANIFRRSGILYSPVATASSVDSFITTISCLDSFNEVHALLINAEKLLSEGKDPGIDRPTLIKVNRLLTESVNHFTKFELSLTSGAIDSFMEDIPELPKYISGRFGEVITKSLMDNQELIISRCLITANGELKEILDEDFFGASNTVRPHTLYFIKFYSIIAVDLMANELNAALPESSISVSVLEQATPLLYKLVDRCIQHSINEDIKGDTMYLKTRDDVVLEVMRGAINPDFFLIRKVTSELG